MGAGKTTVGRLLARELGYHFFDTDTLIEQVAGGKTINEIFTTDGEEGFRNLETKVLAELSAYTKLAIATGGGIVLRRENWGYLRHGLIVWLDISVDILMERLAEDATRPLLKDADPRKKLETLLEQRQRLYAQADIRITIEPGQTPEQVAQRVMEAIPSVIKPEVVPPGDRN